MQFASAADAVPHVSSEQPVSLTFDRLDFWSFLRNGTTVSTIIEFIGYPLDLIKTRSQAWAMHKGQYSANPREIYQQEGVRGFYKGAVFNAVTQVPSQILYYGAYECSKQALIRHHAAWYRRLEDEEQPRGRYRRLEDAEPWINLGAGMSAELVSALVWVPSDLISQRLMLQGPLARPEYYSGGFSAARRIFEAEGIRGLYRGFGASMALYMPMGGLFWATYDWSKRALMQGHIGEWPAARGVLGMLGAEHTINTAAGATAGFVSAVCTQPLDVAKTRLQVQSHSKTVWQTNGSKGCWVVVPQAPKYRNIFHALELIAAEEGGRALFAGLMPRLLSLTFTSGFTMAVYELIKGVSQKD